jgi:hypothetical protein
MRLLRRPLALLALALAVLAALTLGAREASAFCGFYVAPEDGPLYNDASQVALMRDGTRTVISMSNNYRGPAKDFALVVPVPVVLQKENVKTLPRELFTKLESLSAPRLVEYWEQDPCAGPLPSPPGSVEDVLTSVQTEVSSGPSDRSYGVKVEARFTVGEYDIVVLSAKESDGLERWLRDNRYNIPRGASEALAPYIREQQKFFVARVNIAKVKLDARGSATLSPLRFSYEAQDFRLPVRLGLINASGKQDLLIYLIARSQRYEVANYPNVFIPTNLEVNDATRRSFGPFYAALFDEAVKRGEGRGIVTEYAWQTGSCDPCPSPPLEEQDIMTLGGDVLYTQGGRGEDRPGVAEETVLTRLHARYDGATLRDDLVFAAAPAVVGGREIVRDPSGQPERGAQADSTNNFQARYIIRHPWTGPVTCQSPHRGIWGGPPDGQSKPVEPALGLAAAPRENVAYLPFLKSGEPEFSVRPASVTSPGGGWARPFPRPSSCACHVAGSHASALDALALAAPALAASAIALRRRAARRRGVP